MRTYDNAILPEIERGMGWDNSASQEIERRGLRVKFVAGPFSDMMIGDSYGWSCCVLNANGITATLLAKSRPALERLYRKLQERAHKHAGDWHCHDNPHPWQTYYSNLWERRYKKWICAAPRPCECQLCRSA